MYTKLYIYFYMSPHHNPIIMSSIGIGSNSSSGEEETIQQEEQEQDEVKLTHVLQTAILDRIKQLPMMRKKQYTGAYGYRKSIFKKDKDRTQYNYALQDLYNSVNQVAIQCLKSEIEDQAFELVCMRFLFGVVFGVLTVKTIWG